MDASGGGDEFRSIATCHSHIRSCFSHPPNKACIPSVCSRGDGCGEKKEGEREEKEEAREGSIEAFTLRSKERTEGRKRDEEETVGKERRDEVMNKKSRDRRREGQGEKERWTGHEEDSQDNDAGREGTRGPGTRRLGLISPDGFAITVQIIIPLPSTSIDMSHRIYIFHGYDPRPTSSTFSTE